MKRPGAGMVPAVVPAANRTSEYTMQPTPFDDFLERIAPYSAVARGLAKKFGVFSFWEGGSAKHPWLGHAALWQHIQQRLAETKTTDEQLYDPRFMFAEGSVFREFHRASKSFMAPRYGDAAFAYANSMMGEAWSYACHLRCGERVYEVSPGLATLLARTELRGVKCSDLRLPYRSVYVRLPVKAGLKDIEGDVVEGFFVTEAPTMATPLTKGETGRSWWILSNSTSKGPEGRRHLFFNVDLADDQPVEAALDAKTNHINGHVSGSDYYPKSVRDAYSEGLGPSWRDQFKWIMNVVLYATHHPDAEQTLTAGNKAYSALQARIEKVPKGSPKRERLQSELRNLRPCYRIVLGASVDPESVKDPNVGTGESQKLLVRTLVSGHWRRQPFGEGRALRKLIWIEPFFRGPDGAPEVRARRLLDLPRTGGTAL